MKKGELMMSRHYRVKAQEYDCDGRKVKQYYAMPCDVETLNLNDLLDKMTLSPSRRIDVKYGFDMVVAAIHEALQRGAAVSVEGLGRISVSCSSRLFNSPREVTPSKVNAKRIVFRPDAKLSKSIKNIKYIMSWK